MHQVDSKEATGQTRLELLDKIWKKVSNTKQPSPLIGSITQMTRSALNATASSLLLLDEENQELFFKYADGPVGKQLKRLQISGQSGVAGWVVRHGRPLIVNNVDNDPRFNRAIDQVSGFVTRSIVCAPLIVSHRVIGVIEVLNKQGNLGFSSQDLQTLTGVATIAALAMENARLHESLLGSYKSTINALVSLADAKEASGDGHSKRVARYALMGAAEMAFPDASRQVLEYAAILHDIGKLVIPDSILNKAGPLTDEEWQIVRQHPVIGSQLLRGIPFLKDASQFILYHHEKYDGTGYPRGLKAEAIPLGARLIAVADAFDMMTTAHAYRASLGNKAAFDELRRCMGTQFCPESVKAFCASFVRSQLLRK